MAFGSPDYRIGIVIDDDGYVLVTLLIAGLINTDIHKIVEPA